MEPGVQGVPTELVGFARRAFAAEEELRRTTNVMDVVPIPERSTEERIQE
jgi:hypothetical protein